jgi:rRNA maturation endonuclease Nob1
MNNGQPSFEEILEGLKALQKDLAEKEEEARKKIEEVLVEKRSIDQMIQAAERTGKYQLRGKRRSAKKALGDERMEEFRALLASGKLADVVEDIPGSFTAQSLAKELGWNVERVRAGISTLREAEEIRLVGERKLSPDNTGRASLIFVADVK